MIRIRRARWALSAVLTLGLPLATVARAAEPATEKPVTDPVPAATETETEEAGGPWSFEARVDYVTAYMFRGYNNVDTGYIFQPSATVTHSTTVNDNFSFDVYGNVWASISEETPGNSGPHRWNELDLTGGVSFAFGKWSLGLEYLYYNSPANDFDDVHEAGVALGYDHWLAPSIALYRELDDRNGDEDTYLQFSIEPELPSLGVEKLSFTVPVVLGTSLDGFYQDSDGHNEFFGFASIGLSATFALTDYLSLEAGVDYYQLLADSVEEMNSGGDYKVVGRFGVAFTY